MASRFSQLLAELKRRKVYKVTGVYIAVGVGILGAAEVILDPLGLEALRPYLVILVLLGLPIALVLAWAYEVRPEEHGEPKEPGEQREVETVSPPVIVSSETGRKSIVVLPFDNMSPDPGDAYFADGLTEEIIADLSKLHTLRVISRTSAMSLKNSAKDTPTIARDLNVRFVLEGSVRRAGDSLRITAQLIDAVEDTHLWAEKYSGTLEDVFDLQEQLSRKIIEGLRIPLSSEEERFLSSRPIPDPRAYEHYLRARPNIYAFDAASVKQAQRDLQAGLDILGENVDLLKGLGMALFQELNAGFSDDPKVVDSLEACAARIRALDRDDPSSFLLGGLAEVLRSNGPEMVMQLREAFRRDPSDRDTLLWLGVASLSLGQPEVAEKLIHELYRVDPLAPLSPLLVGYSGFFRGRFDEAARYQEESLRLGPDIPVSLWCAVRTFIAAGDPNRATECAQRLRERDPESPFSESSGLLLSGLDGTSDSMPEASQGLRSWAARDGEWGQYVSDAYAFGGDQEKALEWLELARQGGFYNHIYLTRHDPFVRDLAKTAEWEKVLARIVETHRAFEERLVPIEVSF
ncbi:MAG: hypothetical protein PVJ76_13250 [Gemmatimonadota bacterium]|jgi:TolB-like protein